MPRRYAGIHACATAFDLGFDGWLFRGFLQRRTGVLRSQPQNAVTGPSDRALPNRARDYDSLTGIQQPFAGPRPDAQLRIEYRTAPPGDLAVFEVSALVRALKTLVSKARPLRASNAALSNDASQATDADVSADRARIAVPKAALDQFGADITAYLATLARRWWPTR